MQCAQWLDIHNNIRELQISKYIYLQQNTINVDHNIIGIQNIIVHLGIVDCKNKYNRV